MTGKLEKFSNSVKEKVEHEKVKAPVTGYKTIHEHNIKKPALIIDKLNGTDLSYLNDNKDKVEIEVK